MTPQIISSTSRSTSTSDKSDTHTLCSKLWDDGHDLQCCILGFKPLHHQPQFLLSLLLYLDTFFTASSLGHCNNTRMVHSTPADISTRESHKTPMLEVPHYKLWGKKFYPFCNNFVKLQFLAHMLICNQTATKLPTSPDGCFYPTLWNTICHSVNI